MIATKEKFLFNLSEDPTLSFKKMEKDSKLKIIKNDFDPNLIDVKLRCFNEEKFYSENDDYRKNIRRGNSFYQISEKKFIVARKGLEKFFYLQIFHLKENLLPPKSKIAKIVGLTKNIIFNPIFEAFANKENVNFFDYFIFFT